MIHTTSKGIPKYNSPINKTKDMHSLGNMSIILPINPNILSLELVDIVVLIIIDPIAKKM